MRFISLFAFAFALLQVATAAPVTTQDNGVVARGEPLYAHSDQHLVRRGKRSKNRQHNNGHKPPPPSHINSIKLLKGPGDAHRHSAANALKALNLHGHKRKEVVAYHKKEVAAHMANIPGAHSAVIKNLAHSVGSRDPHMHISAQIFDKHGKIIEAPRRGNTNILDPTHHIYVDTKKLPAHYIKAVNKKQKNDGKHGGP